MRRWFKHAAPGAAAGASLAGAMALALALALPATAAPRDCAELKAEIEAKIQAQGVVAYTLEVVPVAEVKDPAMVVGSCANGTQRILYQKNDT